MAERRTLTRRLALLSVLLVGGGALAALWAISADRDPVAVPAGPSAHAAPPSPTAQQPAAPLAGAPQAPEPSRARVGPELAHWIDGRVLLPADTPADETHEVVALPLELHRSKAVPQQERPTSDELAELEHGTPRAIVARAVVADDGTFRIGFPEDVTGEVRLVLKASYLFLDRGVPVQPGRTKEVELEPRLGGRLVLRGSVAGGEDPRTLAGTEVLVQGYDRRARNKWAFSIRELELGADGTLTCDALATDREYIVRARPVGHTHLDLRGITLVPGETTERALEFSTGAGISGRVVTTDGTPVGFVVVQAVAHDRDNDRVLQTREVHSDADGSFTVSGLPACRVKLFASHPKFVSGFVKEQGEHILSPNQLIADVKLVLELGDTITGQVRWPDGSPATRLEVRAVAHDKKDRRGAEVDDDGAFEVAGLARGPHTVYAEKTRSVDGATTLYSALASDVAAGTRGLVLVLGRPPGLAGRVVDDRGTPVARFSAWARPHDDPALALADKGGTLGKAFVSPDGSFALPRATPGTWRVGVSAEGYVELVGTQNVVLPASGEPLVIVLHRGASASGVVLDASGDPVSGAEVQAGFIEPGFFEGFDKERSADSDEQGRFLIDSLPPGSLMVLAEAEGWAMSAPVTTELEPGDHVEGLRITLLRGGTLTGEVLHEGQPGKASNVQLFSSELGPAQRTKTSEDGRFTIEHISAGSYNVIAEGGDDEPLFTAVEIRDGETTHVTIGAATREIRVHGRITRGGAPFDDGDLIVLGQGGSLFESLAQSDIDDDGRYAVALKRPGTYTFFFERIRLEHRVTIPDVQDHELDVELPAGTIAGRVRDASGPLHKTRVTLFREDGLSVLSLVDGGPRTSTDESGHYRFDGLAPGVYSVGAGGGGSRDSVGRGVRGGLVLGWGATLNGVDFALAKPGRIEGVVTLPGGRPVANAALFVRDADGAPLHAFSQGKTDRAGRFEIGGVAPGRVTLFARTGDAATAEVVTTVVEGETMKVELILRPGTLLRVTLRGANGELTTAAFSVRDERGREHAVLTSEWDMTRLMNEGYTPSVRCVGPLPPGSYRVQATAQGGRSTTREVELDGQDELALELVLE